MHGGLVVLNTRTAPVPLSFGGRTSAKTGTAPADPNGAMPIRPKYVTLWIMGRPVRKR
jgi:hypothetical protein